MVYRKQQACDESIDIMHIPKKYCIKKNWLLTTTKYIQSYRSEQNAKKFLTQ